MAQKKKNLKQQKHKQKQHQKQTVIVNVLTSKSRRSTKKSKSSSSSSAGSSYITSTPIIQTLPVQYTPYTMYDISSLLTEANRRSLVPSETSRPLAATDTSTQEQLRAENKKDKTTSFLEDPNKQTPKVNDILEKAKEFLTPKSNKFKGINEIREWNKEKEDLFNESDYEIPEFQTKIPKRKYKYKDPEKEVRRIENEKKKNNK